MLNFGELGKTYQTTSESVHLDSSNRIAHLFTLTTMPNICFFFISFVRIKINNLTKGDFKNVLSRRRKCKCSRGG